MSLLILLKACELQISEALYRGPYVGQVCAAAGVLARDTVFRGVTVSVVALFVA